MYAVQVPSVSLLKKAMLPADVPMDSPAYHMLEVAASENHVLRIRTVMVNKCVSKGAAKSVVKVWFAVSGLAVIVQEIDVCAGHSS